MTVPKLLQSHVAGRWVGQQPAKALRSAINGKVVAHLPEESPDFAEMVAHARGAGLRHLLQSHFQDRARTPQGAGRLPDGAQGAAVRGLHAHRRHAQRLVDRRRGRHRHAVRVRQHRRQGPALQQRHARGSADAPWRREPLHRQLTCWCQDAGIALHINAFNFPIWGMLEKFAPSFLAGMPCLDQAGFSATSYVAEKAVRVIDGLRPAA
jgi:oxepin-CoA hydrolase/3-oxo-5,6-dehydrosuberyl-CoA semialdehyde dehydrogenase